MTTEPCTWCDHAKAHGWWGESGMTHCRDCHASWTGTRPGHCTGCHRTFGGARGFDEHRKDGVCVDPETLGMQAVPHSRFTGTMIWRRATAFKEAGDE